MMHPPPPPHSPHPGPADPRLPPAHPGRSRLHAEAARRRARRPVKAPVDQKFWQNHGAGLPVFLVLLALLLVCFKGLSWVQGPQAWPETTERTTPVLLDPVLHRTEAGDFFRVLIPPGEAYPMADPSRLRLFDAEEVSCSSSSCTLVGLQVGNAWELMEWWPGLQGDAPSIRLAYHDDDPVVAYFRYDGNDWETKRGRMEFRLRQGVYGSRRLAPDQETTFQIELGPSTFTGATPPGFGAFAGAPFVHVLPWAVSSLERSYGVRVFGDRFPPR